MKHKYLTLKEALELLAEGQEVIVRLERSAEELPVKDIKNLYNEGAELYVEEIEDCTLEIPEFDIYDVLFPKKPEEPIGEPEENESTPEMPEEVSEEPVEEEAPKLKNKGRERTIDRGKVCALYKTGKWTIKDIAIDVGCSDWSVRNILKEEGLYRNEKL